MDKSHILWWKNQNISWYIPVFLPCSWCTTIVSYHVLQLVSPENILYSAGNSAFLFFERPAEQFVSDKFETKKRKKEAFRVVLLFWAYCRFHKVEIFHACMSFVLRWLIVKSTAASEERHSAGCVRTDQPVQCAAAVKTNQVGQRQQSKKCSCCSRLFATLLQAAGATSHPVRVSVKRRNNKVKSSNLNNQK